MCGIAGVTGRFAEEAVVRRMIECIHSRGPDDDGFWVDARRDVPVALGNCRLAIIDLSAAGHMPMQDPAGRCRITYNGELYNFRELRAALEAAGHVFRSRTDTEVVLAAYLQWGTSCLERLVGMFAFAIQDDRDPAAPVLFLARDRLGIKPLYWARARDGGLVFASEVTGILASGLVDPVADPQAVWDYLSIGSVPGPRSIVRGVRSLEPGAALQAYGSNIRTWRYWHPKVTSGGPTTTREAAGALRDLLERVAAEHMVADVPVGIFLSGGIDSAGVLGLVSNQSSHPVEAFTVAFGSGPEAVDELRHAREVASHFGAHHHEVTVSGRDVAEAFDAVVAAMDQPSVDGVNSYFVSQAARRAVTVALSGLGADEALAGYPHFQRLRDGRERRGIRAAQPLLALAEQWAPRRVSHALRLAMADGPSRHMSFREAFPPAAKRQLCRPGVLPAGLDRPERAFDLPVTPGADLVTATSIVELSSYLPNTLLRDVDTMSMAHSLEVRVPYVDHRVVEFALSLPGTVKLRNATGKAVLREALADLLPPASLSRPKAFFSMPLTAWVAGPLLTHVTAALHAPAARRLYRPAAVQRLEAQARARRGDRAWAAAVLSAWLDRHEVAL